MLRMSPSNVKSKSMSERKIKEVHLNLLGNDVNSDCKDQSDETMKLRHQNHDSSSSSSSSGGSVQRSAKLENGVKKQSAASETNSSKPVGNTRVFSPKKSVGKPILSGGDDVSTSVTPSEPSAPSTKIKTKENSGKVPTSDAPQNGTQVSRESAVKIGLKASPPKKMKIDVEFEDTDEEEDNVALKTLMENLEKGLSCGEDAKRSQAMIDDLMSDILEKDVKVDQPLSKNGLCQEGVISENKAVTNENNEKSRKSTSKEESADGKAVSTKTQNIKQTTGINVVEEAQTSLKKSVELIPKTVLVAPKGKDPQPATLSGDPVKMVNGPSSDSGKNDCLKKLLAAESSSSELIDVSSGGDNGSDKELAPEENTDCAEKSETLKTVSDTAEIASGAAADADVVCDNSSIPVEEDDDIVEITTDRLNSNNKRESELPDDGTNSNKKAKIDKTISGIGMSKLETYLTRNPPTTVDGVESTKKEKIYRLTKAELEMLVICKVTEYFNEAHKSEIGAIRKRCEQLEKMLDQWRRKAVSYQKQVTDLQIAVQRVQIKRQASKPAMRSVGLQVQLIRDPIKYMSQPAAGVGKQAVILPSNSMKNQSLVLPKQTSNGQLAFFTNLGTHGALSSATIVANSSKSVPQSANGIRTPLSVSNGAQNVSILQTKLSGSSPTSMTLSSSATPVPMRLVQNQAVRQVNSTSSSSTSPITSTTHSLTVSVVNQPPLLPNAVKLIDLTVEEEEQKAAAAAAAAAVAAATAVTGGKRIVAKPITTTHLATTTTLPAGLTVVPALTSSSTVTVINPTTASVNSGQLITINPGTTLTAMGTGVSTLTTQGTVGVTTSIRGPTTTPVVGSQPVRLTYLMQAGNGLMTMVRPTNGQPVFMAPSSQVRPNQAGNQPLLRPSIPATLVFRQGTTILPIQNGQVQQSPARLIQPIQATKIVTSSPSSQVVATSTVTSTPPTSMATSAAKSMAGSTPTKSITSPPVVVTQSTASSKTPVLPLKVEEKHPAPLPGQRVYHVDVPGRKQVPPKPALKISKVDNGIVLSWNMNLNPTHASISSYQLYAYQESSSPPSTTLWKKVGDVRALPLPMACTLTQFMEGHKYYFAVRAVDVHNRLGPFSDPGSITLFNSTKITPKKS